MVQNYNETRLSALKFHGAKSSTALAAQTKKDIWRTKQGYELAISLVIFTVKFQGMEAVGIQNTMFERR
jgi:hypothetical protein